jgi:hypothetical protein
MQPLDPPAADSREALRQIHEIRRLVEASGRFTLLSAGASLVGGAAAVVGAILTHGMLARAGGIAALGPGGATVLAEIWLGVLGVALAALLMGTLHRARDRGEPLLRHLLVRIGFGLTPSFLVALALTLALTQRGAYDLVAPVWILCYGAGAVTAGLFSVRSVQILGCAFLVAGVATVVWGMAQPALCLGGTFGGFHLIHGVALWAGHAK